MFWDCRSRAILLRSSFNFFVHCGFSTTWVSQTLPSNTDSSTEKPKLAVYSRIKDSRLLLDLDDGQQALVAQMMKVRWRLGVSPVLPFVFQMTPILLKCIKNGSAQLLSSPRMPGSAASLMYSDMQLYRCDEDEQLLYRPICVNQNHPDAGPKAAEVKLSVAPSLTLCWKLAGLTKAAHVECQTPLTGPPALDQHLGHRLACHNKPTYGP